jgi:hypothetical protein
VEKSKAQTSMAATPRRRTPAGRNNGGRFTFDEGISQMEILRDAVAIIRSQTLRLDTKSLVSVKAALDTVKSSGDSASILMGRSLGVCKAALTEFCRLDTFTKTASEWNVTLVDVVEVPQRRRAALVESLTLAVAAFDTLLEDDDSIEESVVDGFCLNCTLLATLAEFARLDDGECMIRAREREGFKAKVRAFDRRGSTVSLRAAGLIPSTPGANTANNRFS